MRFISPKENISLYAISIIALASFLSGYIFRGLTAFNGLGPKVATKVISDIAVNSMATSTMICDLGDLCRKQKLYREAEKHCTFSMSRSSE